MVFTISMLVNFHYSAKLVNTNKSFNTPLLSFERNAEAGGEWRDAWFRKCCKCGGNGCEHGTLPCN